MANPIGAGLNEPVTMQDRSEQIRGLVRQGYSNDEIYQALGIEVSPPEGAGLEEDAAMGTGELVLNYGPRAFLEGTLSGGAGLLADYAGSGTLLGEALDSAADFVGPSDEQEQALAERQADREGLLGFAADAGDAIGAEAAGFVAPMLAGAAAGSVVPGVGTVVGAVLGGTAGILRQYDEGRGNLIRGKVAAKLGKEPDAVTPEEIDQHGKGMSLTNEERNRAALVGALGAIDAFPAGKVVGMLQPEKVAALATRSIAKAGGIEAIKTGSQEGLMEFGQDLGTMLLTDAQLQQDIAKLPEGDKMAVVEHIAKTKGRDLALSFAAGVGLGAPAGGVAGGVQQNAANAYNKQRAMQGAAIAQDRGVSLEQLQEVSRDPEKIAMLDEGMNEIIAAQEQVNSLQGQVDETTDPEAKAEAVRMLETQNKRLEKAVDKTFGEKGLAIPSFRTTAEVRQERADQEARDRAEAADAFKDLGIPASKAEKMDPEQAVSMAGRVREARASRERAQEKVDRYRDQGLDPKKTEKAIRDLKKARSEEEEVAIEAHQMATGAKRPEARKAVKRNRAIDVQRERMFGNRAQEKAAPEETAKKARAKLDELSTEKKEDGLEKKIAKKEKHLDALDDPDEIAKVQREIDDLRARRGQASPVEAAARMALQDAENRLGRREPSPEKAEETPSSEAAPTEQKGSQPEAQAAATESNAGPAKPEPAPTAAAQPSVSEQIAADNIARLERGKAVKVTKLEADRARLAELEAEPEPNKAQIGLAKRRIKASEKAIAAFDEQIRATEPEVVLGAAQRATTPEEVSEPVTPGPALPVADRLTADVEGYPWTPLDSVIDDTADMASHEQSLRDWTGETKQEAAAFYDENGTMLGVGTSNDTNQVAMPGDPRIRTMTHTHPEETSFSVGDLRLFDAFPNLQTIRAVMPSGEVLEVTRKDALSPEATTEADRGINEAIAEVLPPNTPFIERARITQEAKLRLLAEEDAVSYSPKALKKSEEDVINAAIDRYTEARNGEGLSADARARAAEAEGRPGRPERAANEAQAPPALAAGQDVYPDFVADFQAGRPVDELIQRQEFKNAVAEMMTLPSTRHQEGFWSPAWQASREYEINGRKVRGVPAATMELQRQAIDLAADEMKLPKKQLQYGRKVTIITGPPASGKSTEANKIAYDDGAAIIDSDEAKKIIPEFGKGEGANAVHEESKRLMEPVEQALMEAGANVVYPKVGHEKASIDKLARKFKNAGYEVNLVDLRVESPEAMRRMLGRFGRTGRLIPPSYLLDEVGDNPSAVHAEMEQEGLYDGYAQIDGMGELGTEPAILSRSGTALQAPGGSPAQRGPGAGAPGPRTGGQAQGRLASGLDLARTAETPPGEGRSADPARISDLVGPVYEAAQSKTSKKGTDLENEVINKNLTREGMEAGLDYAVGQISSQGTEASTIVLNTARMMYPDAVLDPETFVKEKSATEKGKKVTKLVPNPEWQRRMNAAFQFLRRAGVDQGLGFEQENLPVQNKTNGRWFTPLHFKITPKMEKFLDISPPEKSLFTRPMSNPTNTDAIVRTPKTSRLSQDALEPMRNTARILQENEYTLDQDYISALTADDMISEKQLGQAMMKRSGDGTIVSAVEGATELSEDQQKLLKTQRFRAKRRLQSLQRMAKAHGDQVVGFRYRVDDKGRIAADGPFNPQTGDAVKGAFIHESGKLGDMPTVDHSASGWQVAVLLTRDDQAAGFFNLGPMVDEAGNAIEPEIALQEGYRKRDMYNRLMSDLQASIEQDAAAGEPLAKLFKERVFDAGQPFGKGQIKPAVIAVNYGAEASKFQERFLELYGDLFNDVPAAKKKGLWGYLGNKAYGQLSETAPKTMAFQRWAIDAITDLVEKVEGNSNPLRDTPKLEFSVGLDGKYAKLRAKTEDIRMRANDTAEHSVEQTVTVPKPEVDPKAVARSVYSQIIQGFDASILHRTYGTYKENDGGFITSNHDSYTVPRGSAGQVSAAARQAMKEIMTEAGDVPARLRQEIEAQAKKHGVDLEVQPPPGLFNSDGSFNYGDYDLDTLDTSVPLFVENAGDVPPALTDVQGNLQPGAPAFPAIARSIDLSAIEPTPEEKAQLEQERISTRFPTQKASTEDPIAGNLQVGIESMKSNPDAYLHNMRKTRQYPSFNAGRVMSPDRIAEAFKQHVVDNLLWIHDLVAPDVREATSQWYDGANRIARTWSEKYGIPPRGVAAALAALSPQKDWFQNVSLAERVLDIVTEQGDRPWSNQMSMTLDRIFPAEKFDKEGVRTTPYEQLRQNITNKTLNELTDPMQAAAWVRVYDETYHPRGFRQVAATGEFVGEPTGNVAWGSNNEIGKAVAVIRDPSYENISRRMGQRHKVRSFYNNILAPWSQEGDVTIDTHAVAAGVFTPLAGGDVEVADDFGNGLAQNHKARAKSRLGVVPANAKASGLSGSQGLYGLYADAYRDAAAQRGILPRQMQSITWEAVRSIFDKDWKTLSNLKAVDDIWRKAAAGEITNDEARQQILDFAGGHQAPAWYGRGTGLDGGQPTTSYERDVSGVGLPGTTRGVDSGDGGRASGTVPAQGRRFAAGTDGTGTLDGRGVQGQGSEPGSGTRDSGLVRRLGRDDLGQSRPAEALEYADAMQAAAAQLGPEAAQVSRVEPDADVERYLLDGGATGYALDGDNIIGVFSRPDAPRGAAQRVLQDAVARGGRRLDGFDTYLPKIYAKGGFRAVARLPFNPEYAPSVEDDALKDWDAKAMERLSPGWGNPDVVFMVYDPANASPDTDNVIGDYDEGPEAQSAALSAGDARAAAASGAEQPGVRQGGAPDAGTLAGPRLASGVDPEAISSRRAEGMTPFRAMADLRHNDTTYDQRMNAARERDGGKDYGRNFLAENLQFTKEISGQILSAMPTLDRDGRIFANEMIVAQKRDFNKKIDSAVEQRQIPADVGEKVKIRRQGGTAYGIDLSTVSAAPKKRGITQPKEYKTPERVASAVFSGAADPGSTFDGILKWFGQIGRNAQRKVFNKQAGLQQIEALAGQAGATVHDGMARFAQMMTANTGRVAAMMSFGAPKWNAQKKIYEIDRGTRGLDQIFSFNGVEDYQNFQGYAYAKRDRDLMAQGKGARMTDDLRAEFEAIPAADKARYDGMLDEYKAFNGALRNLMKDSGLIDEKTKQLLEKENEYVPMYRVFDDPAQFGLQQAFAGPDGFSHPDPGVKKMKVDAKKVGEPGGGEFGDLMEGIHNNAVAVMHAASQNLAHAQIYDFMKNNLPDEVKPLVRAQKLSKKEKKAARRGDEQDAVKFMKDGKEYYWRAKGDPEWTGALQMALAGLAPQQLDAIDRALKKFNNFQRRVITGTPAFAIRSVIRDTGQAYVQSGTAPAAIVRNNAQLLAESWGQYSQDTQDLMMASGVGGYQMQGMPEVDAANLRKKIGAQEAGRLHQIRTAFGKYERVIGGTELGARKSVYEGEMAKTGDEASAAYEALNMIDYGRKGASKSVQRLTYMVLFLNPRLQGLYRLFETTTGDGTKKWGAVSAALATRGMVLMGLGMMIRAMTAMDDDDEERYRALSVADRSTYFHIPLSMFGSERFLRLPKPFEIGAAFATLPVGMIDAVATGPQGMNDLGLLASHVFMETFSFNPTPQAVRPVVEVMMNRNMFTGREIEGMRLQGYPKALRSDLMTGGLAKALGNQTISPVQIQHLLNGYLGPLGMFAYDAVDASAAGAGFVDPKGSKSDGVFGGIPSGLKIPADFTAKWMFSATEAERGTKYVSDFYDLHNKIKQYTAAANEASRMGDFEEVQRLSEKSADLMRLKPYFNKVGTQLSKLGKQMRVAQMAPGLASDERQARIDKINRQRNKLTRDAIRKAREAGVVGSFAKGLLGETAPL